MATKVQKTESTEIFISAWREEESHGFTQVDLFLLRFFLFERRAIITTAAAYSSSESIV